MAHEIIDKVAAKKITEYFPGLNQTYQVFIKDTTGKGWGPTQREWRWLDNRYLQTKLAQIVFHTFVNIEVWMKRYGQPNLPRDYYPTRYNVEEFILKPEKPFRAEHKRILKNIFLDVFKSKILELIVPEHYLPPTQARLDLFRKHDSSSEAFGKELLCALLSLGATVAGMNVVSNVAKGALTGANAGVSYVSVRGEEIIMNKKASAEDKAIALASNIPFFGLVFTAYSLANAWWRAVNWPNRFFEQDDYALQTYGCQERLGWVKYAHKALNDVINDDLDQDKALEIIMFIAYHYFHHLGHKLKY